MKRSSCGMAEPNPTAAPARPPSPLSGQAPLKKQRPLPLPVLPSHSSFVAPLSVRSQLGLDLAHRPDCPKRAIFPAPPPPTLSSFDLAGIVHYIKRNQCKNIIVMTGAGVSVSAGIPDFRSPGTGLYHNLQKYNLPTPESVFALDYFEANPRPFCMLAKELYPGNFQPTPAHHFVKLLHDQGLLLRNYTQNIDGLERLAGVPPEKLVEAHGTFATARCLDCRKVHDAESVRTMLFRNEIPRCDALSAMTPSPASKPKSLPFTSPSPLSGASTSFTASSPSPVIFSDSASLLDGLDDPWNVLPSSSDDSSFAAPPPPCSGLVKPDIVFFGESLPHRFFALAEMDFPRCDLLIVMGTSLEVHPFAGLIHRVRSHVPRLLVNLNPVGQAPTVRVQFVDKGLWTPELSSDSSGDDSSNCGCETDETDASSTSDSAAFARPSPSPAPSLPARTPSVAVSEADSSRSVSPTAANEEVKQGSSSSESESDNDSEDEAEVEDGRPHAYFFRRSNGVDVYIERGSESDPETLQLLADIRADARLGLRFHLPDNSRDVFAQGTCDAGVKQLAALLGWDDRLERAIASAAPVRPRTQ